LWKGIGFAVGTGIEFGINVGSRIGSGMDKSVMGGEVEEPTS